MLMYPPSPRNDCIHLESVYSLIRNFFLRANIIYQVCNQTLRHLDFLSFRISEYIIFNKIRQSHYSFANCQSPKVCVYIYAMVISLKCFVQNKSSDIIRIYDFRTRLLSYTTNGRF